MPQGPLGGPRPFARDTAHIVVFQRWTGRPRENISQEMLDLEERIRRQVPNVPLDGQTIFTNLPSSPDKSNTIELSIGLQEGFRSSPQVVQDTYNAISEEAEKTADGELFLGFITAGDPQEVLKR